MMNTKLKQFGTAFLIVLSLFVSSISACACSRHQEKTDSANAACHHDSEMSGMEMPHDNAEKSAVIVSKNDCSCIQSASKVFTKNETLKVEKHLALTPAAIRSEINVVAPITEFKPIEFESPFYLSDSFYNLSPGRAPPRL